jgi:hypothetical protein
VWFILLLGLKRQKISKWVPYIEAANENITCRLLLSAPEALLVNRSVVKRHACKLCHFMMFIICLSLSNYGKFMKPNAFGAGNATRKCFQL